MLARRQDLRPKFEAVWRLYEGGAARAPGPIGVAREAFSTLGWEWVQPCAVQQQNGRSHDLTLAEDGLWEHELRDGFRKVEWSKAAARRNDCKGMNAPDGVDRVATTALYSSSRLTAKQKGTLRGIQAGAVWTQER